MARPLKLKEKKYDELISISLTKEDKSKLDQICSREDRTPASFIRILLRDYFIEHDQIRPLL